MRDVVGKLKEGKSVEIPIYDFTLHQRVKETKRVYGATGNCLYILYLTYFSNFEARTHGGESLPGESMTPSHSPA